MATPCLAGIETHSLARGYRVADAALKSGPVTLLWARTVSPGRFLVLLTGEVQEVREAFETACHIAGDTLVDRSLIPETHPDVLDALQGRPPLDEIDALGIVETSTVISVLEAADRAAKEGEVRLLRIRIAMGMGGKGLLALTGAVSDVEPAVEAAATAARVRNALLGTEIIPHPDDDLIRFIGG